MLLTKNLTLLLLICLISTQLVASDYDSLYRQAWQQKDPAIAAKAIELATGKLQKANALFVAGRIYQLQSQHGQATKAYFDAALIYNAIGEAALEAQVYENIAITFHTLLQHRNAIHFYNKAMDIKKRLSDPGMAKTARNLALSYQALSKYDTAVQYYLQALDLYREHDDKRHMMQLYNDLGAVQQSVESYDFARKYYIDVLTIATQLNDTLYKAHALNNIGSCYLETKNYQEAEKHLKQANSLRYHNPNITAAIYNNLGRIHMEQHNLNQAEAYYMQAYDLADNANTDMAMETYLKLSQVHEQLGNPAAALAYSREYETVTQQLLAVNQKLEQDKLYYEGQLVLQQLRIYEQQKREQDNQLLYMLVLSVAGMFSIGLFVWLYRKYKSRDRSLDRVAALASAPL